jgi:hypothetical protein
VHPVWHAILTTLRDRRGENWSAMRLAAEIRMGGIREIESAVTTMVALRYIARISARGGPYYVIQPIGQAALDEQDG